jgi:Brp/Blh family beta-carotene 15,15'-monooxygenase
MARPIVWVFASVLAGRVIWLAWIGGRDRNPTVVLEALRLTAFAGLFATAPVLLSFVTYFCGWHSTRELRELALQANPTDPFHGMTRVIRESAPLTLVVVSATAFAAWWRLSGGHSAELVTVQAVFLGLSAVAVPHILLHAIARKHHAGPFCSEANG